MEKKYMVHRSRTSSVVPVKKNDLHANTPAYPMRINKYLAHKGYSSRREADGLIVAKKVLINGVIAVLGDKVNENDSVEVRKPVLGVGSDASRVYLAFHKPSGVVTALPRGEEKAIADILKYKKQTVFPIGRLDKATRGLMILTNDTRITNRMLNPVHDHEKEYIIRLDKHFSPSLISAIEKSGGAKAEKLGDQELKVVVFGAGVDVRSICGRLNFEVMDMKRSRIMNIKLGDIEEGDFREITGLELKDFLRSLGL